VVDAGVAPSTHSASEVGLSTRMGEGVEIGRHTRRPTPLKTHTPHSYSWYKHWKLPGSRTQLDDAHANSGWGTSSTVLDHTQAPDLLHTPAVVVVPLAAYKSHNKPHQ